jgi:raffinose/stachyose/melibiose transport system permease protein
MDGNMTLNPENARELAAAVLQTEARAVEALAARIDGANSFRILRSVLLPISWPPILTLATLMFIWSWNEFILSLVVLTSPDKMTAPAGLGLFVGERISDVPGLSAGALIVCLPTIFLYVVLNRKIISGILQGAVKG